MNSDDQFYSLSLAKISCLPALLLAMDAFFLAMDRMGSDVREIGDVNEGVIERSENTGNAEDELAWSRDVVSTIYLCLDVCNRRIAGDEFRGCTHLRGRWGRGKRFLAQRARPSWEACCLLIDRLKWVCNRQCSSGCQVGVNSNVRRSR